MFYGIPLKARPSALTASVECPQWVVPIASVQGPHWVGPPDPTPSNSVQSIEDLLEDWLVAARETSSLLKSVSEALSSLERQLAELKDRL